MMSLAYDLHIHPCPSPCEDDDMTPVNTADMVALKGLNVVVLIGYGTCRNCSASMVAAVGYGMLAVPDVKTNASKGIHVVCLFPMSERVSDFDTYVCGKLIKFPNREGIFGKRRIYDGQDQVCTSEFSLLINATEIPFDNLWNLVRSYGGVIFPVRVDKATNSLIVNLGSIPPDSCFKAVEVKDLKKLYQLKRDSPYLEQCRIINNPDAHYLGHTDEANLTTQVEERSAGAVVRVLLQE